MASQEKNLLLPTRELPRRQSLRVRRTRGFYETIGLAARRDDSPANSDSTDDGWTWARTPRSHVSVAGGGVAASAKKPRGRGRPRKVKTAEGGEKRQASRKRGTSKIPPPVRKGRRGRKPKGTQRPPSSSVFGGEASTPVRVPRGAEGDTTETVEGPEGELATLKKLFGHVWSDYYAPLDNISGDQMELALNIFLEKAVCTD